MAYIFKRLLLYGTAASRPRLSKSQSDAKIHLWIVGSSRDIFPAEHYSLTAVGFCGVVGAVELGRENKVGTCTHTYNEIEQL